MCRRDKSGEVAAFLGHQFLFDLVVGTRPSLPFEDNGDPRSAGRPDTEMNALPDLHLGFRLAIAAGLLCP